MAALNQGRSRLGPYREQRATRGERRGSRESEQSLSSRDRFIGQRVVLLALPRRQRRVAKNRCAPERVSPESRAGEPHAGPRREARHGVAQRRTSDWNYATTFKIGSTGNSGNAGFILQRSFGTFRMPRLFHEPLALAFLRRSSRAARYSWVAVWMLAPTGCGQRGRENQRAIPRLRSAVGYMPC